MRVETSRKDVLRIVACHRVERAEPFERQIEHLVRTHEVVSIPRMLEALDGGRPLPPRALLLLFDDAPRTFADVAWPILARHGLASVLSVRARDEQRELLDWDELRALSRAGVALAARTRPRLDRVPFEEARGEILGSLSDLEREVPGLPRLFAWSDEGLGDELVGVVRGAGVELAFTAREGTNDLRRADRLRLRCISVDAGDSLDVLRARLAANARHGSRSWRRLDPPSADEERCERAARADLRRVRVGNRLLDGLLIGALSSGPRLRDSLRGLTRRRSSNFERVRCLASVVAAWPALGGRLRAALLDTSRLPFPVSGLQVLGHGTGKTVFALESPAPIRPQVLKVYRRSIGRPLRTLLAFARRQQVTYGRLHSAFGAALLPAQFLVVHGPLRGLACLAALQERIPHALDPIAMEDARLLGFLRARPELALEFAAFAANALELRGQGFFPDLFGPGNLLVLDPEGAPRLRLVDAWLFDLRLGSSREKEGAVDAMVRRLESLLRELARPLAARLTAPCPPPRAQ